MTTLADAPADTRERLLHVAMALFAEHGIDRISLKTISDAAGNRNKSAVGYHFDNKQGLVDAVLRRLESDLAPQMRERIGEFGAALDRGERLTVEAVVAGLLEPILHLYTMKPYGPDALRVLARIMHDPVGGVPRDLREASRASIERIVGLLHRLLPEKRLETLQHHVHHAVMATVNGLALQERFVTSQKSLWGSAPAHEIFLSYASYVSAGLASAPRAISPDLQAAWRARFERPNSGSPHD